VLVPSTILLVYAVTMGAVFWWDVRGIARRMRTRFESRGFDGVLYRALPTWAFRAFGAWCFVFGVGQFVFFWRLQHWRL
jgi:hypothetical protein